MVKKIVIIFIGIFVLLLNNFYISATDDLQSQIYQKIFRKMVSAIIYKLNPPEIYQTTISKEEIRVLKEELKKIRMIREYAKDAAVSGDFKEEFHDLVIQYNNRVGDREVLYSIKERSMIVRKRDVFSKMDDKSPKITVYEFKVPEKVVAILERNEAKLPREGFSHGTWPIDSIF